VSVFARFHRGGSVARHGSFARAWDWLEPWRERFNWRTGTAGLQKTLFVWFLGETEAGKIVYSGFNFFSDWWEEIPCATGKACLNY